MPPCIDGIKFEDTKILPTPVFIEGVECQLNKPPG